LGHLKFRRSTCLTTVISDHVAAIAFPAADNCRNRQHMALGPACGLLGPDHQRPMGFGPASSRHLPNFSPTGTTGPAQHVSPWQHGHAPPFTRVHVSPGPCRPWWHGKSSIHFISTQGTGADCMTASRSHFNCCCTASLHCQHTAKSTNNPLSMLPMVQEPVSGC
jgi:hypothetical protein